MGREEREEIKERKKKINNPFFIYIKKKNETKQKVFFCDGWTLVGNKK